MTIIGPLTGNNTVIGFSTVALDMLRATGARPPEASRAMAMVHIAVHNAADRAGWRYRARGGRYCGSAETACAVAARTVLTRLFPGQSRFLHAALGASLSKSAGSPSADLGSALGQSSGESVLQWRKADPTWEPLRVTSSDPEHTSAHCAFSGAASRILRLFLGRDDVGFSLTSEKPLEITRSFRSFSEAAMEAAESRIYAGLHFEFSTSSGLAKGRCIADHVWRNGLRPHGEKESLEC